MSNPATIEGLKVSGLAGRDIASLFSNIFDFFGVLDDKGRVIELQGSIFRQASVDPALLVGHVFSETVFWQSSPDTAKLLEKTVGQAVDGEPARVLIDFRLSADKKLVTEVFLQSFTSSDGELRIFFGGQRVKERERSVDRYKQEIEELLFAAENADIGLWFWDLAADVIYSTPKCNELFQVPAYDSLTYEKFMDALHPDDRERVAQSLLKAHVNGTKYTEEYRVLSSDGTIEWISAEGKSFLDDLGKPQKMTSVVRRITEQKIASEELAMIYDREKRARDEAVEASRAKDLFLAFVSHELRSPLNAILGWSKILLSKKVDDETRTNALETIERSARIQNKLINDLVDSARVASGKIRLEFRPINIYDVVQVCFRSQQPAADSRNIEYNFVSDKTEIPVFGDSGRLQQVFNNLISNALKFTPEKGKVSVKIKSEENSVSVTVTDSGRGISGDALPNIFRQFAQGDIENDKNKGGLGLGLSIVNILVAKHRGSVVADSGGLGKGSSFIVTLPLSTAAAAHVAGADGVQRTGKPPLFGLKIMLVEDDADSREVLQLFLEQNGAAVLSAESSREAIELFRRSAGRLPDVIISDLAMPDEDGYAMIARIRSFAPELGGSVPALALSAFASNESKQKAFESGFQVYSTKPFEPDLLIPNILELVRSGRA